MKYFFESCKYFKSRKYLMKRNAWKTFSAIPAFFLIVSLFASLFYPLNVSAQRRVYDRFMHNTAAHRKQSCNSCHKTPTGFSNAKILTGENYKYPDITDYPEHASCLECHRQQFFKGARPAICSICHTKVSPRDKARFPFPQANQPQEFTIRFRHDLHQDIIAGITPPIREDGSMAAHFINTKFTSAAQPDDKKTDYNNCTICHAPADGKLYTTTSRKPLVTALETGLVVSAHAEKVTVPVGYFKGVPDGHNSCFNCHYSEQRPTRTDCAGCHIPNPRPAAELNAIERLSLKFNHEQKTEGGTNPHDKECSSCHLRITQSADLRSLNPDVPIFTCATKGNGCHSDEIKGEVDRREEDLLARQANAQHRIQNCSYCHNSFVGSYQVPESHKGIKP